MIERARQAGLVRLLIPAVDVESSRAAIELADRVEEVYAAVGIHPNDLGDWNPGTLSAIRELAGREKAVAIGEIGLDYYWDAHPRDLQRAAFSAQLELAAELGLPVVVHNRDATADVLAALLEWSEALRASGNPLAGRPGVMHSFSGEMADADRAVAAGFLIGITGPVTFRKAIDLQAIASALPLNCLLIETDAPYLTPHPYRGTRNEPAYVRLVAEKIAELKGLPVGNILRATYENSVRLFNW